MNEESFLQMLQERGATFAPPATQGQISLTNLNLQKIRAAMLPPFITQLYQKHGGIKLGTGYIFGPNEVIRPPKYPVPNIFQINSDLTNLSALRGKTVFGRNDLFWFAFDSFGTCMMLDNLNLNIMRKYEDPYRAMLDCLIGGKM